MGISSFSTTQTIVVFRLGAGQLYEYRGLFHPQKRFEKGGNDAENQDCYGMTLESRGVWN